MTLADAAQRVLTRPDAAVLWELRTALLEAGVSRESRVWSVVEEFHRYLDHLATRTSSRDYSHLASKLDITAVGGSGTLVLDDVSPSDFFGFQDPMGLTSVTFQNVSPDVIGNYAFDDVTTAIPEPSTALLLGFGLMALAAGRRGH